MQVQSVQVDYDADGRPVLMRVGAIGSELMAPLSFPFELPGPNADLAGMDEASFNQMLVGLRATALRMCEMAVQSWIKPPAYDYGARRLAVREAS